MNEERTQQKYFKNRYNKQHMLIRLDDIIYTSDPNFLQGKTQLTSFSSLSYRWP